MEPTLPIENPNLPADHQDAGDEPLPRGETPGRVNLGVPGHSPDPVIGGKSPSTPKDEVPVKEEKKSPTQIKHTGLSFGEAVLYMQMGRRVTKLVWNDSNWFGELRDGKLMLRGPDGAWHDWVIQEGDLIGNDWEAI